MRGLGRMFRTTGLQIGYRYENSPICIADGSPPIADDPEHFVPSARPGARAPHAWLAEDRSMLDLFGRGFVLLRFGDDAPEGRAFVAAAAACELPLEIVTIADADADAARLYGRRLVLVRPDGHVAWRGDALPANAAAVLDKVRGAAA
jgi:hypothetical protein